MDDKKDGKTMERYYPFEHRNEQNAKPAENPAEKPAVKPTEKPTEKPAEELTEKRTWGHSASDEEDRTKTGASFPEGKGRRGGNSAASVVLHSGKTGRRERSPERPDGSRYEKDGRNENTGRNENRFLSGNKSGGKRTYTGESPFGKGNCAGTAFFDRQTVKEKRTGRNMAYPEERPAGGRNPEGRGQREDLRREGFRREGYQSAGSRREEFRREELRRDKFKKEDLREGFQRKGLQREKDYPEHSVPELVGKRLSLTVAENTDCGAFLDTGNGKRILLPFAEQTARPIPGETVEVSVYEDKGGRLTATMRCPILRVGETGVLTVAAVTKIGAFLDNGMPKQVLVPFREMLHTPSEGDRVLVWIYQDKSGREAGTMRVYRHLEKESGYAEGDRVEGFVYEINPDLGVFVAVDNRFCGMIPIQEVYQKLKYGDVIAARVSKVREDGKLDLLLREKLYEAAVSDAQKLLTALRENGGMLPYADRADAELIREKFSMSKNEFKRALGALYKKREILIDRENDTVKLITKN